MRGLMLTTKDGADMTIAEVMNGNTLPALDEVGERVATWQLPVADSNTEPQTDECILDFHGPFLGMGTTQRASHSHNGSAYIEPGEKCGACRWHETRIFYDDDNGCYIVHFSGRTSIPTEAQRFRIEKAYGAFELIAVLTSVRTGDRASYLPLPALRALSQAASFDDDIREAYTERAQKL